jgi:tetratricopeptide (TPR) repeat protein
MAWAATNRPDKAESELTKFGDERKQIFHVSWGNNPPDSLLDIAENLLRARIATARGNLALAIEKLQKAVKLEDDLKYDEPPPWLYPARQSLGGALIRDGKSEEARKVFEADLADNRNPKNGRSLFGLARALEKLKDPKWKEKQALYEKAWEEATKQGFALDLDDLWGAPPPTGSARRGRQRSDDDR